MFYLKLLLRTTVWESASQIALRNCSNKIGEEPGYIVFLKNNNKNNRVAEHQHIIANQKRDISSQQF